MADRYGRHINQILSQYSASDIADLMALDLLNDPESRKKIMQSIELEESRFMTVEERVAKFDAMFGVR